MKKYNLAISILAFIMAPVLGQNQPAAKATAKIGSVYALHTEYPTAILSQTIKRPPGKVFLSTFLWNADSEPTPWFRVKKANKPRPRLKPPW